MLPAAPMNPIRTIQKIIPSFGRFAPTEPTVFLHGLGQNLPGAPCEAVSLEMAWDSPWNPWTLIIRLQIISTITLTRIMVFTAGCISASGLGTWCGAVQRTIPTWLTRFLWMNSPVGWVMRPDHLFLRLSQKPVGSYHSFTPIIMSG